MKNNDIIRSSAGEYLTYVASVGGSEHSVEMRYQDENIWLTQKLLGELYGVEVNTINYHIKKIFADNELDENSVIRKFRITASDGKEYNTNHYDLSVIFAVGYKVDSEKAVQFRKWITGIAKEYTIKAWVMDVDRIKQGTYLSEKYFDEQLSKIREIRASERKFYQKVTDIYATSLDYDSKSKSTQRFFKTVQNKLHWAIHKHTAPELIMERADSEKEHMGLTTWADAPDGKIKDLDVVVAKNYLTLDEIESLDRIVVMYLDYAEDMARRKVPMTMSDWEKRLNAFLQFNERDILENAGKVKREIAEAFALSEFEKYRVVQDKLFQSDFDKFLELEDIIKEKRKIR
jgi:hypothetical protein